MSPARACRHLLHRRRSSACAFLFLYAHAFVSRTYIAGNRMYSSDILQFRNITPQCKGYTRVQIISMDLENPILIFSGLKQLNLRNDEIL